MTHSTNPSSKTSQASSERRIRAHAFISGQVQGVGYRASVCDTATLLKLNGWVRNLKDGRVEAVFEGSADPVEEMIRWCHHGPPTAIVSEVSVEFEPFEGLRGFQVAR